MKQNGTILKTNARRYALIGASFGLLFPVLAILIRTVFVGIPLSISSILAAFASDPLLWIIITAPFFLGMFAAIAGRRQDELEKTNLMLQSREQELEGTRLVLEERVDERTRELTSKNQLFLERAQLLSSVVDTSRSLLATLDLSQLLPMIVELTSRHFDYYHVGLYLLDEQKQNAVLVASSREGGPGSLQRGQQVNLHERSLVASAIRSGQPQIMSQVRSDMRLISNPELPDTRDQLVLPLASAQIVIGTLDFQADREMDFTEEYISILQILADLVTIAIENSLLYEKTQRTLREAEDRSRQISAKEWSSWVESIQAKGYRYDGIRAEPLKQPEGSSSAQKRVQNIPVRLRGRTIGNLKIKLAEGSPEWTEDDRAIAEATAERAALALEGARLLDEAKRRAAREAFLSEIASKLGASFRLDSILRDTVEELGQSLEHSTVSFQLIDPTTPPGMRTWEETAVNPKDSE
jgi:GAF domain-containing protein/membrane protein implicated in regulation of membrane protease activity